MHHLGTPRIHERRSQVLCRPNDVRRVLLQLGKVNLAGEFPVTDIPPVGSLQTDTIVRLVVAVAVALFLSYIALFA